MAEEEEEEDEEGSGGINDGRAVGGAKWGECCQYCGWWVTPGAVVIGAPRAATLPTVGCSGNREEDEEDEEDSVVDIAEVAGWDALA